MALSKHAARRPWARPAAMLCAASLAAYAPTARTQQVELDASYGTDGTALSGERLDAEWFGGEVALPPAATVLDDGSVLFAGRTPRGLVVQRLDPSGAPDRAFGSAGTAPVAIDGGSPGLLVAPDGRLILAGTRTGGVVRVARLLPDGSLDRTFGSDGYSDRTLPGAPPANVRIARDDAGRIVVTAGGTDQMHLWRLRADGADDPSFVGATVRQLSYVGYAILPIGIVTMADGSTFVLAERPADLPEDQQLLLRFDADGRYDRLIGTNFRRLTAIYRDRDALYVLGLDAEENGAITWLRPDGSPDTRFCGGRSWALPPLLEGSGYVSVLPLVVRGGGYLLTLIGRIVARDGSPRGLVKLDFEEDCSPFYGSYAPLDVAPATGLALGFVPGGVVLAGAALSPAYEAAQPAAVRLRWVSVGTSTHPGRASFGYDTMVIASGQAWVDVPIRRTGGAAGPASVDYQTFDGSARAGEVYEPARGRIDWAAGETSTKSVRVRITVPPPAGSLLRFTMTLSNARGATLAERPSVQFVLEGTRPTQSPPPTALTPVAPTPVAPAPVGGGGALSPWELACLLLLALVALARRDQCRPASYRTPIPIRRPSATTRSIGRGDVG